ncbi:histidine kinase [Pseudoxanthomonas mexicana]|uniref:histidine kinase n=1 Tax=Pseudoxanthomonas mexicana TaxID=128785 RepID=UPI000AD418F3|nr:histidine kinase [Pseudoxanthomonas mexicana]
MPAPPPITPAVLLQLFRLQEAERRHVGRALHNQIGQALSAIKMGAHLVQSEDDADARREDLQEIIRASEEAVALTRDLHATLHPPQLESIGLDAALRAESERLFPGAAVALAPLPHAPSPDVALVAFRIAQVLMRAIAQARGELSLALAGDTGAAGGFTLDVDADVDADVVELPLLQALAIAVDGGLDGADGTHWRLRLPYAATSATSADPA